MMRNSVVFGLLVAAVAAYSGQPGQVYPGGYSPSYKSPMPVGYHSGSPYYYPKTADVDYLHKQKKIYELLWYVDQNYFTDAEYYEAGHSYDIAANIEYYTNKDVVHKFLYYYKLGFISKSVLFSVYNEEHREEMMMLYKLFYYAKDFATFYKTASWARLHMNPGLYVTAFSMAVFYRDDTKYIQLPAIYEIYPHLFFDSKVIQHAQHYKMSRGYNYHHYPMSVKHDEMGAPESFHIYSNYSEYFYYQYYDDEYKLNYFYHDVDLNAWYYYFRMSYPFWSDVSHYNVPASFRGDFYYYFHKQLMSRYYLERMSNGLGQIEDFSWDKMHMPAYHSNIMYYNGVYQPHRNWWYSVPTYKHKYVEYIKVLENRILDAIDSGFIYDDGGKQYSLYSAEGLNYLGNLIEGNYNSYNNKYYGSYDTLARDILGMDYYTKNKNFFVPSSLQCFATSARDPAFYRLYDKIVSFFQKYKSHLPHYTKTELEFPGVKFEGVEVDKLVTYFDYQKYYINNAVAVDSYKDGSSFSIKAWQYHLNYKPFTYKFHVSSDKDTKAIMHIFLGPAFEGEQYTPYSYLLNYYQYFFQLDQFEVSLKSGINTFDHHSYESSFFKGSYTPGDEFYHKITKAIQGSEPFSYSNKMWGFPEHLMLPKGSVDGMKFKLFFFISPYHEAKEYEMPIFGTYKYYGHSFGYPLDRPMYPWFFQLGNAYFKDVYIYHIKDYDHKYGSSSSYDTHYDSHYDSHYEPHYGFHY